MDEPRLRGRRRLRILTWHVHGNYLYALSQVPHDFVVPTRPGDPPGYAGLGRGFPWGANISEMPAQRVRDEAFDCVLFQSRAAFERDRHELLAPAQLALPCAYLEHNPPEPHPTGTRHVFRHDRGVLVHVTHYNALMWDAGDTPVRVVEHGVVPAPGVAYDGSLARGIVVANHLARRGRRIGADLFAWARERVPLDLIGMDAGALGGLGEIPNMDVPAFVARYRFFFSPVRYASLGLSAIEAMLAGVPVVGVAATELPAVIRNGVDGYVDTRPQRLVDCMRQLLADPALARQWGEAARRMARQRFGIGRFVEDWLDVFSLLVEDRLSGAPGLPDPGRAARACAASRACGRRAVS